MREERGQLKSNAVIKEPFTLWGVAGGNVKIAQRGKFYLRGSIYGDLVVEPGGRAHLFGNLMGSVTVMEDAKVILSGTIGGDVHNLGGRLHIENSAKIGGKVKTSKKGQTTYEPKPGDFITRQREELG